MNENNNTGFFSNPSTMRLITILLVIAIAFGLVKVTAQIKSLSYIGKPTATPDVITVSGKGEVVVAPDIATFSFGVTEEAVTVGEAQKKSTDKIDAILASIKKGGVEDKDIKTVSYNIYPRYEYHNATMYTSGTQYLAAYVVSQTVEVKVRDLTKAGGLLSGIGEYGATNISGLAFSIDEQDKVIRDARADAIKDAREQAEVLARALGVNLGRITSFYESTPYQPYPIYYAKDSMSSVGMGGDAPRVEAAIPAGENKITSNVTITYEIK